MSDVNARAARLAALGLDPSAVGAGSPLPTAEPASEAGSVRAVAVGLAVALELATRGAGFVDVSVAAAAAVDAFVAVLPPAPNILRVTLGGGEPADVRLAGDARRDALVAVDPDDASTVTLDAFGAGVAALLRSDGTGVLVERDAEGVVVVSPIAAPIAIAPLAPVAAPVAEWCAACDDPWLTRHVTTRLAVRTTWQELAAAGMVARLAEPRSPAVARRAAEALLARRTDAAFAAAAAPRRWARALSAEQVATVRDLAIAEVERIFDRLEDVTRGGDVEDAASHAELLRLCHARDDVEGVRVLLAETGGETALGAALALLDHAGHAWATGPGADIRFVDERLRRVAIADPAAWWSAPAAPEFPASGAIG